MARAQAPDQTEAAPEAAAPAASEGPTPEPAPEAPTEEELAYAQLVDDALREFGAGHYREAADDFRQALAIRPSARALRGLGKALFELGEYVDAATAFERALVHPVDPLTDRLRADVEALLARAERHIGTLVISVNVPHAEILLDGEPVDLGALRLDAGQPTLQVRAPEHLPYERTVAVVAGERVEVDVQLERRPDPTVTVVNEARSGRPIAGGVLAGVGVVGAVFSTFWLRDRIRAVDDCPGSGPTVRCTNRPRLVAERRAAAVSLAVGVAGAVVGAVLLLVGGDSATPADDSVAFDCGLARDGGGCSVGGSF